MKNLFFLFLLAPVIAFSQGQVSSEYVDSLVRSAMDRFPQAGISVAVIQNGEVTHLKGYGVTSIETGQAVDENTLFGIASNTKAFITTALGMLVDQGKLGWNDRVIDHIPEFRMYDPYVTAHFTIVDLLTHRSGLGLGAGDLMFIPDGSDFTIDDIISSFQYQEPVSDFRTKYDYDNLLYMVAGEVIHRVSGKDWDRFVEEEIMAKLGMSRSSALFRNITDRTNIAMPHYDEKGELRQIETFADTEAGLGAAGGIYASAAELSAWVKMHLNKGMYGDEQQLISSKNQQELWKIQTMQSFSAYGRGAGKNHFRAYGLGFVLQDENGYTVVSHTGGLPGMLSMVTMVPELNAGIIVLTNTLYGGLSFMSLSNAIRDRILGIEGMDWLDWAQKRVSEQNAEAEAVVSAVWKQVEEARGSLKDPSPYIGRYRDDWFGDVLVYEEDGNLFFRSTRSPKLKGKMHYYGANTFAVAWDYRDLNCDAFAMFNLDENGNGTAIKMKGISPDMDFSFDFQDLDLKRVKE